MERFCTIAKPLFFTVSVTYGGVDAVVEDVEGLKSGLELFGVNFTLQNGKK